jgi:hypothetical protein
MKKLSSFALAAASLFVTFNSSAQFADAVVSYSAGTGINPAYNDPTRALGAPTTYIGYQNADPFNPPYDSIHLVSVGTNGSLTVQFNSPILNSGGHAFGLDFIIFGNTGFIENFSTGQATGGLFGQNPGSTRVSISADGINYFMLNPGLAPTVDGLFPPDASGDFTLPVDPSLTAGSFAGLNLAGIRSLYAGSGGGTGYDISWAQDGIGNSVFLSSINFVRVDVLSGKAEIDAFVAVPEPGTATLAGIGGALLLFWSKRRSA